MVRSLQESAAQAVWPAIVGLRRMLVTSNATSAHVGVALVDGAWRCTGASGDLPSATEQAFVIALDGTSAAPGVVPAHVENVARFSLDAFEAGLDPIGVVRGELDPDIATVLRIYLPSVVGGHRARRDGGAFVLAHIAQTLDGRIACRNGQSHWISNEANLHHAHRLRALHDAVLVGGRTVECDDPQLTVRHVEGDDPERVVLSARAGFLRDAREFKLLEGAGTTVLCRQDVADGLALNGVHQRVRIVPLEPAADEWLAPADVVRALAERGLHSVFLEGGGETVSSFLHHDALDVLHIHVAPVVLGSGVPGFRLPEVGSINDARRLQMEHFDLSGEVLLECRTGSGAPRE